MRTKPPPPPITPPPSYQYYATCEVCWEACNYHEGVIGRFMHRRKWGHNPLPIGRHSLKRKGESERERSERER